MGAANLRSLEAEQPLGDTLTQARRLHNYLLENNCNDGLLEGPDPGVRFNYRIGRFIKSYLSAIRWRDTWCFMQTQGYWILANWRLFGETGAPEYRKAALRCSQSVIERQRADGAWDYPKTEWKGRVATVEGCWACFGLLESYLQTGEVRFLDSARRWHEFLIRSIGFLHIEDGLAVNYFANRKPLLAVPNNSAIVLRFLAELAHSSKESAFLAPCNGLLKFLESVQKDNGEFPYAVQYAAGSRTREHFQCYQYHAFLCLDLIRFHERTGDKRVLPLVVKVLSLLRTGLGQDGHAFYQCGNQSRIVSYHTAVLAAAFQKAGELGVTGYEQLATRAYSYLLSLQRVEGDFPYSHGEYQFFSDRRSYPRALAMTLLSLLQMKRPPCA
jgi:hypothetical protein